jgi:glycosyltransferase involved in cell wall biosynthesis
MKSNFNIDVIISVYNGASYIAEAIESVLLQKTAPKSIIVVDDCSTDETPSVLNYFGNNIRVIRHKQNCGLPATRNTGIRSSVSEFIAFLDADDKWMERKLEKQVAEFIKKPGIGLCYTDIIDCDSNLTPIRNGRKFKRRINEDVLKELYLKAFPIPPSTVMVRREVFDVCGLFNESMLKAQDYECWLRIAMKYSISCIDKPFCYRRDNPASITNTSSLENYVNYTFRAFDLCSAAAAKWGIELPIPLEERKKLYLYRACRESIVWSRPNDAAFFYNKLLEFGKVEISSYVTLKLLKFYMHIKSLVKKL